MTPSPLGFPTLSRRRPPQPAMKNPASDLFEPRSVMDSDFPSTSKVAGGSGGGGVPSDRDFAFAFNNNNFSDRVLRIEIVEGGPSENKADGDACLSIADWASNRKRRREDGVKKEAGRLIAKPRSCVFSFFFLF